MTMTVTIDIRHCRSSWEYWKKRLADAKNGRSKLAVLLQFANSYDGSYELEGEDARFAVLATLVRNTGSHITALKYLWMAVASEPEDLVRYAMGLHKGLGEKERRTRASDRQAPRAV